MNDIYFPGMKQSDNLATATAIQAGADPADLAKAKQEMGKNEYIGYCESFVEKEQGSGWKGTSASAAWQNQQDKAIADPSLKGVKPGDAVYFNDPSNPDGHVGIMDQGNNFISATDNGVQSNDIADWTAQTHQNVLGYIPQTPNIYFPGMTGGQYGSN